MAVRLFAAATLLASTLLASTLLVACSGGRALRADESPALKPDEGLLVVAVETNVELTLAMCRDDMRCITAGPVSSKQPLTVLAAPAGRYCLTHAYIEIGGGMGLNLDIPAGERCFELTAGALVYPGHLELRTKQLANTSWEGVRWGWQRRDDTIRQELVSAYPKLAALEPFSVYPTP